MFRVKKKKEKIYIQGFLYSIFIKLGVRKIRNYSFSNLYTKKKTKYYNVP